LQSLNLGIVHVPDTRRAGKFVKTCTSLRDLTMTVAFLPSGMFSLFLSPRPLIDLPSLYIHRFRRSWLPRPDQSPIPTPHNEPTRPLPSPHLCNKALMEPSFCPYGIDNLEISPNIRHNKKVSDKTIQTPTYSPTTEKTRDRIQFRE